MTAGRSDQSTGFPPVIENGSAKGRAVIVCEHASNHIPALWGDLGLTPDQRSAHIAWDPGALGLARGLARHLDAVLVHAPVSRLVYDCNRAPDMAGAMPARSEVHDIPGNAALSPEDRAARTAAVYVPFHDGLHAVLMDRIARGLHPALITIHSFTPVYFGQPRTLEFGVIHDADDRLPRAILAEAQARTRLRAALNEPYSAQDDVTHTLRLHATPYGLPNAMLEVRNDLLATPEAEAAMAATLAPVLAAAMAALTPEPV
ncbi:MAG: N-formylglutamate amidohydrolase [Rhodobacteraceae bacterium]|nr:N-formylglutamate amidohydrolase [Paracoccaceae bacterium]